MNKIESIPIDLLSISPLRKKSALPWPNAAAIYFAQRYGITGMVVGRELRDEFAQRPGYEILKGLPIWLLAQKAAIKCVPVMILEDMTDQAAEAMITGDDASNPITTAESIDDYCYTHKTSVASAARHFGVSRAQASHLRRLLTLDPNVKDMVRDRKLSFRHAKMLVSLPHSKQLEIARRVYRDKLSSRQCESMLGRPLSKGKSEAAPERLPLGVSTEKTTAVKKKDPDTLRLEESLSEQLGTQVAIDYLPSGSGSLVIGFYNLDSLDGVLQRLGCFSKEETLGEQLGTTVTLKFLPDGSGSLVIGFQDLDSLDGLLQRLGCADN